MEGVANNHESQGIKSHVPCKSTQAGEIASAKMEANCQAARTSAWGKNSETKMREKEADHA